MFSSDAYFHSVNAQDKHTTLNRAVYIHAYGYRWSGNLIQIQQQAKGLQSNYCSRKVGENDLLTMYSLKWSLLSGLSSKRCVLQDGLYAVVQLLHCWQIKISFSFYSTAKIYCKVLVSVA